jgi:flagella basal body P-ring formation protein FlgA
VLSAPLTPVPITYSMAIMKSIIISAMILWCAGNVYAEGQVVSAKKITDAINDYVITQSGVSKDDLSIEYKNPILDETVPAGELTIQVNVAPHVKFIGFTAVGVTLEVDGKPYRKFLVYVNIDSKVKAYMTTRWINHQEPLTSENLMLVETYRSKIPMDCVVSEKELAGKVAKMALPKGKFIAYSVIDTPSVIKNRDVVDVLLSTANLKIMAKGAALMDGKPGEIIKLRLLDSKREIYGKVVDATTVNVQMPN